MAYNFSYGGGAPAFSDISFSDERKSGGMGYQDILSGAMGGGGKDPFKNIMGGGGSGGGYQYSSMGASRPGGGASMADQMASIINQGHASGGIGGSIPTITPQAAAKLRSFREMAPYMAQQQAAQAQNAGQMQLAQLQGRIQLATAMAQIQAEREARLSMQIDNEKARQLQLEMQRRNFGADDYQTKQQFHYQYGI